MQRKSNSVSGWVNFPVGHPDWGNSQEGGLVVKLVVCDDDDPEKEFAMCCGASVIDALENSFIGDDQRQSPASPTIYDSNEAILAERAAITQWEEYHYPRIGQTTLEGVERYLSRPYLAAIVIGTTGWSGWHKVEHRYWQCGFDDLTNDGKALYRQLEMLYPGCGIHLLTFLDT